MSDSPTIDAISGHGSTAVEAPNSGLTLDSPN